MSAVVRARVTLEPGCRLLYDNVDRGGSFSSMQFFEKYYGRMATLVGFSEEFVGPLDTLGREPGRYVNPKAITVQFDGEDGVHYDLNIVHFVIVDTKHASFVEAQEPMRKGHLPFTLAFYPGDLVRVAKDGPLGPVCEVTSASIRNSVDGIPRYVVYESAVSHQNRIARLKHEREKQVHEGARTYDFSSLSAHRQMVITTRAEELVLVSRGNVWNIYNDPDMLSFENDADELAFWSQSGLSKLVPTPSQESTVAGRTIASALGTTKTRDAYQAFRAGAADLITQTEADKGRDDCRTYLLFPAFVQYRTRVRALTKRVWEPLLTVSAA